MTEDDTSGVKKIPVIDLSQEDDTIVKELMTAFTTIGFATLINHGVAKELRTNTFAASKSFFQLPLAQKLQYQYVDQESNRGYIRCGSEHHDDHLVEGKSAEMDCKETVDMGYDLEPGYKNQWPSELSEGSYKNVLLDYFETMDALQLRLMKYVAVGLGVDPSYLVERCDKHHENLRLLHYPATHASGIRGNAHTDFGTITLLVQDQVGGLKVQRTDGTWIDVEPTENSIIVNVGDMLMRWSNDKLKATLHKVEAPPNHETDIVPERYSIAFFCNANKDVELKCLDTCFNEKVPAKYPPINAHMYITQRLLDTINTTSDGKVMEEYKEQAPSSNKSKLVEEVILNPEHGTSRKTVEASVLCDVCHQKPSKYTCPRCQLPYCSIDCYRNHNVSPQNSSEGSISSCTEIFYKTKVNDVLQLERKEREEENFGMLNYQQQQQNTEGDYFATDTLAEEDLFALWTGLEALGEEATQAELNKLIPPSLQSKFKKDLQLGTMQNLVLQDWFPWWRKQLVAAVGRDDEIKVEPFKLKKGSKTLDERLLELPTFESLCGGRAPSPVLLFNLIEVLYGICSTMRLYHGSGNAIANEPTEAAASLIATSAVLSKDGRFSSLTEVLIHCTRGGKGDPLSAAPWEVLVEDVSSLFESHRLVGRALLEAKDILTAARKEIKQKAKSNNDSRRSRHEQIAYLSILQKKLVYFLSWSQHCVIRRVLKESDLKEEISSWREEWASAD